MAYIKDTAGNIHISYPPTSTTGSVYTYPAYPTTGTGTQTIPLTWQTTGGTYTISDTISANPNLKGTTLKVQGNADIDGDLKVKGKSLNESLERIEERLAILRPNEELEEKWEKLRDLRKAYMELEAEIIEKEKMWDILKK
jgi:hypothetical protein